MDRIQSMEPPMPLEVERRTPGRGRSGPRAEAVAVRGPVESCFIDFRCIGLARVSVPGHDAGARLGPAGTGAVANLEPARAWTGSSWCSTAPACAISSSWTSMPWPVSAQAADQADDVLRHDLPRRVWITFLRARSPRSATWNTCWSACGRTARPRSSRRCRTDQAIHANDPRRGPWPKEVSCGWITCPGSAPASWLNPAPRGRAGAGRGFQPRRAQDLAGRSHPGKPEAGAARGNRGNDLMPSRGDHRLSTGLCAAADRRGGIPARRPVGGGEPGHYRDDRARAAGDAALGRAPHNPRVARSMANCLAANMPTQHLPELVELNRLLD